jgi:hypothetical protein
LPFDFEVEQPYSLVVPEGAYTPDIGAGYSPVVTEENVGSLGVGGGFSPVITEALENLEVAPPDSIISVKVSVFLPQAYNELGSYEIVLDYDSSVLQLVGVRDWDTTDGFPAPQLNVLGENSEIKISQTGRAPAGSIGVGIVDFVRKTPGTPKTNNITLKRGALSAVVSEPVYSQVPVYERKPIYEHKPIYDENGAVVGYEEVIVGYEDVFVGYRSEITGYTYTTKPIDIPVSIMDIYDNRPIVIKSFKNILIPMKFWIIENSGQTGADVLREVKEIEDTFNKAADECKLEWKITVIAQINHVPKGVWDNIVGADNILRDNEWLKLDNYRFRTTVSVEGYRKWINVFLVPYCSLSGNAIGWWDSRSGSIASDQAKDQATHNRNLAHELMHEFSKSQIKDSPHEGSQAQGGRDPSNIMAYCKGNKGISVAQGKILNEEIGKRAQPVDTNGDGAPDYYMYKP